MLYLVIAVVFGSLFATLFKLFQQKGIDSLQAIGINYIVALVLSFIGSGITETVITIDWRLIPALLAGLFMMGGFVTMNSTTRSHGVAVATISARVSFVIPVLCAYLFLQGNEPQWLASAMVIVSLLFIFFRKNNLSGQQTKQWLYPLSVFLCYGLANFMLKLCQMLVAQSGGGDADLSFITGVTFLAALVYTIIYYYTQPTERRSPITWQNIAAGIILGATNMGCTYFLLKSLMSIDSSIFYPLYNISIVLIATIAGRVCFGEKLSHRQYIGIAVAIGAIVLFFNS